MEAVEHVPEKKEKTGSPPVVGVVAAVMTHTAERMALEDLGALESSIYV